MYYAYVHKLHPKTYKHEELEMNKGFFFKNDKQNINNLFESFLNHWNHSAVWEKDFSVAILYMFSCNINIKVSDIENSIKYLQNEHFPSSP